MLIKNVLIVFVVVQHELCADRFSKLFVICVRDLVDLFETFKNLLRKFVEFKKNKNKTYRLKFLAERRRRISFLNVNIQLSCYFLKKIFSTKCLRFDVEAFSSRNHHLVERKLKIDNLKV